jgi:hypothetical protein
MKYLTPFDVPLKEYEGLIARREYWDDISEEWSWSTTEQKLVRLAGFVQQGGDLAKLIDKYAEGRDDDYRHRIQFCLLSYILKLMVGERMHSNSNAPLVSRIKRLNKEELVELMTEELKRDVKKSEKMDSDFSIHEDWELLSDKEWMSDEILDRIEYRHWHEHPEESWGTYSFREKYWWEFKKFLW